MKKILFVLIAAGALYACGGNSTENTNAQAVSKHADGENDNLGVRAKSSVDANSKFSVTADGVTKEFNYISQASLRPNNLEVSPDKKMVSLLIDRVSNENAQEKLTIYLANYNPEDGVPIQIQPGRIEGKQAAVSYQVKRSGMYLTYRNLDNCYINIDSYKDGVIEGTFSADVANEAGVTIKLENGSFKAKINRQDMQ